MQAGRMKLDDQIPKRQGQQASVCIVFVCKGWGSVCGQEEANLRSNTDVLCGSCIIPVECISCLLYIPNGPSRYIMVCTCGLRWDYHIMCVYICSMMPRGPCGCCVFGFVVSCRALREGQYNSTHPQMLPYQSPRSPKYPNVGHEEFPFSDSPYRLWLDIFYARALVPLQTVPHPVSSAGLGQCPVLCYKPL